MKKNGLLKAIVIMFLAFVLLSWIIPAGYYSGEYVKDSVHPLGLGHLFAYPSIIFAYSDFTLPAIIILLIGALYGVLNKTGVYQKLVEGTKKKFEGKKKLFLIISVICFAILASLTGEAIPLFILVPFVVAVILSLGFNKMTAMLSTVGSILVGNMATVFGNKISAYADSLGTYVDGYTNTLYGLGKVEDILLKVILLVLLVTILIIFIIKTSKIDTKKKNKKEEKEEIIPLYKKGEVSKKSSIPMIVIMSLFIVIVLVGIFNWSSALKLDKTIFDTWYTNIMATKINGYPIFEVLLGGISQLGRWNYPDLIIVLTIVTLLIGLVYKLKIKEIVDSAVDGMKEVLSVAAIVVLANLVTVILLGDESFMNTIYHSIMNISKGFNAGVTSLVALVGSIPTGNYNQFFNSIYSPAVGSFGNQLPLILYIVQTLNGFVMFIVPTSVVLVAGLEYLNISYKEWLKENWRLLLCFALASFIMILTFTII